MPGKKKTGNPQKPAATKNGAQTGVSDNGGLLPPSAIAVNVPELPKVTIPGYNDDGSKDPRPTARLLTPTEKGQNADRLKELRQQDDEVTPDAMAAARAVEFPESPRSDAGKSDGSDVDFSYSAESSMISDMADIGTPHSAAHKAARTLRPVQSPQPATQPRVAPADISLGENKTLVGHTPPPGGPIALPRQARAQGKRPGFLKKLEALSKQLTQGTPETPPRTFLGADRDEILRRAHHKQSHVGTYTHGNERPSLPLTADNLLEHHEDLAERGLFLPPQPQTPSMVSISTVPDLASEAGVTDSRFGTPLSTSPRGVTGLSDSLLSSHNHAYGDDTTPHSLRSSPVREVLKSAAFPEGTKGRAEPSPVSTSGWAEGVKAGYAATSMPSQSSVPNSAGSKSKHVQTPEKWADQVLRGYAAPTRVRFAEGQEKKQVDAAKPPRPTTGKKDMLGAAQSLAGPLARIRANMAKERAEKRAEKQAKAKGSFAETAEQRKGGDKPKPAAWR